MIKRSIKIKGHATSVTLEREFWEALESCASKNGLSVASIITEVDRHRSTSTPNRSLSSCLRVWILRNCITTLNEDAEEAPVL